jgi:hypothetical protein
MRKSIFIVSLLACSFVSCKKGNLDAHYHLTATIDNKAATFNVNPVASFITFNGFIDILVEGQATSSQTNETLIIGVTSITGGPVITPGIYTDTSKNFEVQAVYQVSPSEQYVAGTELYKSTRGGATPPIINHFTLVITELDSVSVKGTFSGDLFTGTTTTGTRKTITNCEFYEKFY